MDPEWFFSNLDPDQLVSYPQLPGSGSTTLRLLIRIQPYNFISVSKGQGGAVLRIGIVLMPIWIRNLESGLTSKQCRSLCWSSPKFFYTFNHIIASLQCFIFLISVKSVNEISFYKILRCGDYGTVKVCGGNDSKFHKNIRHDLFFFIWIRR